MQTCPMCGEWVATGAAECAYCGENFAGVERTDDPSLSKVRTGIALVYYGLIVMLLTIIGGILLVVVTRDAAVLQLIVVLAILASVLGLIGKLMCLAVPPAVGATGVIYTSVGIDILSVILRVADHFAGIPPALGVVVGLAGIIGYVLFVIFLQRLSNYIGRTDLASMAGGVLTAGALGIILYLAGAVITLVAREAATVGGLVVLAGAIVLLVAFVRYVRVLHSLKATI